MRCLRVMLALPLALALMGASCETRPTLPKIVEVEVVRVVEVPEELSRDCESIAKRDDSVGEAVRLANARRLALEACTERMRQIRELKR